MSEKTDLLLKYWEEERAKGRQSENQRATITNYIILISSLIITVIAESDFKSDSWPLAILLIALGFFGFIITRKYYGRWKYHMKEAKFIMREAQLISGVDAYPSPKCDFWNAIKIV